jgi:hypothetical protein
MMPVNIICPSQFGQGGRSIAVRLGSSEMSVYGMMLPLMLLSMLPLASGRERDTLGHRYVDSNGDGIKMNLWTLESLPNIDQF